MTEVHSREALRLGIHPGAVILRVAGYDVAGRGRGGVQEAIGLSHDSFETEFVMEIGGEAPGPASSALVVGSSAASEYMLSPSPGERLLRSPAHMEL